MFFLCSIYFCVVLCIVCFVSSSVLFVCICVLNYCHQVATQLQLNISYHISYHIISYHIRKSKVHLLVFLINLIHLINACNMVHIKLSYTSFTPLKYHFSLYFQAYWYICLILAEILKSHWLDTGLLQTNSHFHFTIIVISGSFKVLQQCAQGFCWKIRTL